MAYQVVDFLDIIDAVREELKVQSTDTVSLNRIKRVINQVYLQEVVPHTRWKWLEGSYRVIHKARYNSSTVSVTPNSTTVTLNETPSLSLGSFAGKKFAVDGYNEIYIIDSHTAGSTTITLTSNYTGNMSTSVGFKIWTDKVVLPLDCRETVSVWHNFHSKPMEGIGLQKLRQLTSMNQRAEAYPSFYYTGDFHAPTSPEVEEDRYREMTIHPAINKTDCTLQIDYIKEVTALNLDSDEPVIPVEDRVVLVYGALSRLWKSINSDNDNAQLSKADYVAKLGRMSGKIEDAQDNPRLKPESLYVRTRRASRFSPSGHTDAGVNGGSGYESITFLDNPTIKGANITANVTVTSGVTIDGVDLSVLDSEVSTLTADLTAHINDTTDAHPASAITVTPSGNLAATEVQSALTELQSDVDLRALDSDLTTLDTTVSTHIADTNNPHSVTKTQVGLGNVDNTSDATKNSATATLTNKTIDATANTISNLDTTHLAAGILDTDLTTVAGTDTTIPSAKAVKDYVDNNPAGANTNLSNLTAPTAINQDLLPSGSINIGAATSPFNKIFPGSIRDTSDISAMTVDPSFRALGGLDSNPVATWGSSTNGITVVDIKPATNNTKSVGVSSTAFSNVHTYNENLHGSTSGTLTLNAAATTTSHTLTMPATQGAANTFLKNNGSGALSWSSTSSLAVRTITGTDTVASTDDVILLSSSGTYTVSLPDATTLSGKIFYFKRLDNSFIISLDPNGTQTIDGATLYSIGKITNAFVEIVSDGSNWKVISQWNPVTVYVRPTAPTGTLSNTFNLVTFTNVVSNTPSSPYNDSTGIFTAPKTGFYNIHAQINILVSSYTAGQYRVLYIFINGSEYFSKFIQVPTSTGFNESYLDVTAMGVPLTTGDQVTIRSYCDGTSPSYNTVATHHLLSITNVE